MVKVRPFQGYVPRQDIAKKLISYQYDVIDSQEARVLAEGNEHSFLHVEKPEIDLPETIDQYDPRVYIQGRENLFKFIEQGYIQQDNQQIIYVYKQKMGDIEQYGIVLEASVEEYEQNIIKKHEQTREKKEKDRTMIIDVQNANVGPVFLTYTDSSEIDNIVNQIIKREAYFDVQMEDGVYHTLWKATGEESSLICKNFEQVPSLFIADGHHRSASAFNVGSSRRKRAQETNQQINGDEEYFFFMALCYPKSQLTIFEYNRVLKSLNGKTSEQVIDELSKNFILTKLEHGSDPKVQKKQEFNFLIDDQWYNMKLRDHVKIDDQDPLKCLDVQILTDLVLQPIFDITDLRNDDRIDFIGGIRGTKELEKRCKEDCKCAFALYPVDFSEVMRIADNNMFMPPKSTWFEPKPRSGAVVRVMKEKSELYENLVQQIKQ